MRWLKQTQYIAGFDLPMYVVIAAFLMFTGIPLALFAVGIGVARDHDRMEQCLEQHDFERCEQITQGGKE